MKIVSLSSLLKKAEQIKSSVNKKEKNCLQEQNQSKDKVIIKIMTLN